MGSLRKRLPSLICALVIAIGICLLGGVRGGLGSPAAAPLPSSTFSADPDMVLRDKQGVKQSCSTAGGKSRIFIPDLGVAASWRPVDVVSGWLAVPSDVRDVASLSGTNLGDARGTFLLAGHVDSWNQGSGAFYPLAQARPGTLVTVTGPQCEVTTWAVTSMQVVTKDALPRWVYATTGPRRLALITCGGPVIRTSAGNHYRDNVIVQAVMVAGHKSA